MPNGSGNSVINSLIKEKQFLKETIEKARKDLRHAPEGTLQIKRHKNGYQFFHRTEPRKSNGKYIQAKDQKIVVSLIQKRYLTQLLRAALKQQQAIEAFLKQYDPDALKKVFLNEGPVRQQFLDPVVLPDPLYIAAWEEYEYERKPFYENDPSHFTQKDERVRSKSEVMIANSLYRAGVPYRYECPLLLGSRTFHPDFTILRISDRKTMYWEHLGLMDDISYCRSTLQKLETYETYGIFPGDQLILTAETSKLPLNASAVKRTIAHYILKNGTSV